MFSQAIETIKYFTDRFAAEQQDLNRIAVVGNFPDDDTTTLGAVRALLFNRLPEDRKFTIRYDHEQTKTQLMSGKLDGVNDSLNIFKVSSDDDGNAICNTLVDVPGFRKLNDHMTYLSKWLKCWICVNDDLCCAVVVIKELDLRNVHMTMSLFPAYVKPLFKEAPVTENEKALCVALSQRNSEKFEAAMTQLATDKGLEQRFLEHMLKSYTRNNRQIIIDSKKDHVKSLEEMLECNISEYQRLMRDFSDSKWELEMLISQPIGDDTELTRFFKHHKNIRLYDICDDALKIYVMTTLEFFNMDFYRRAADNRSIYAVGTVPELFKNLENRKLLMDAIFSDDPQFKIRMCAAYSLSMRGTVNVERGFDYPADLRKKYLPNPHIQRHACLGDHRDPIRKALREGSMQQAIMQCVASAQSINLMETSMTFTPFMTDLFNSKNNVLIDNKGKEYTPESALKKLKEQKE